MPTQKLLALDYWCFMKLSAAVSNLATLEKTRIELGVGKGEVGGSIPLGSTSVHAALRPLPEGR